MSLSIFLLGLMGLALLIFMAFKPNLATVLVLFIVYTNAAVVGYKYHGVPYIAAASVILLLMLPLAYYILVERRRFRWNPVLIPMFLLLCAQMISAVFATVRETAIPEVISFFIEGLTLYFLVTNVLRDEEDVHRGIWALLAAGAVMGALVLFQAATNTLDNDFGGFAVAGGLFEGSDGETNIRHAGPIGEENNFAQIMVVLVPLGWFMMHHARTGFGRLLGLTATGLIVVGVMLTYSRTGGVVLLLMIPAMAYLTRTRPLLLAAGALAAIILVSALKPDYIARIASLDEVSELFAGNSLGIDRSLRGRASENLAAIDMFYDHPIVGVGEKNFNALYREYAREFALDTRIGRRPHNLYLGIAAEGGIIGLMAFLGVLAAALGQLVNAIRRFKRLGSQAGATLAGLIIVSIVGRMIFGIALDLAYERYLWLLLAVAGAAATMRVVPVLRDQPVTATAVPTPYAPYNPPTGAGD